MKSALVGYTGFVGSNLKESFQFSGKYNSKNIESAYGTKPELLVYAGVRAEKFLANAYPIQDYEATLQALNHIKQISPKKLVLISTIDVYNTPQNVNEKTEIDISNLQPYGANRYKLECSIRDCYPDALIIRLPALFGKNIKKNFIYDYIHRVPSMLSPSKMTELSKQIVGLNEYYHIQKSGFYKYSPLNQDEDIQLKHQFESSGFTALNFTDSRNCYQFYNLTYLWTDICKALDFGVSLLNVATEPISAGELYQYLSGDSFVNINSNMPIEYNFLSIYAEQFGGRNGYLYPKGQIMKEIKEFVEAELQSC